jgi:hypothetical protein
VLVHHDRDRGAGRADLPGEGDDLIELGPDDGAGGDLLGEDPGDGRRAQRVGLSVERLAGGGGDLKGAAAAYLDAQVQLNYAARLAHDAGHGVSELYTSWLTTPAEEAVIEARVEYETEDERHQQLNDEVNKIIDALRANGYEPHRHIEDITFYPAEEPDPAGPAEDAP